MKANRRKASSTGAPSTASELARRIGVSRQLISSHARKPDAPALSDVSGWKVFLASLGREGSGPLDLRRELAQRRLNVLALQESREELRLAAERDEVLDKAEVGFAIRRCVSAFWHALDRAADLELPPVLKGKDEAAIRDELRATVTRMKKTIFAELDAHVHDGCKISAASNASSPAASGSKATQGPSTNTAADSR